VSLTVKVAVHDVLLFDASVTMMVIVFMPSGAGPHCGRLRLS